MKEIKGNIWDYEDQGYIVIGTNGTVKVNGMAVMGRGLAQQAAQKYPIMPFRLGEMIKRNGNNVHPFTRPTHWISFPVKHDWWEKADPALIFKSTIELMDWAGNRDVKVFLPRLGCGNGQLSWDVVKPLLTFDDRFTIVDVAGGKDDRN